MKILPCNQCQWHIRNEGNEELAKCGHPSTQVLSLVTGKQLPQYCVTMRLVHEKCGHDGRLWAYDDAFPPAEEYSDEI